MSTNFEKKKEYNRIYREKNRDRIQILGEKWYEKILEEKKEKKCKKCGQIKGLLEFPRNSGRLDGFEYWCKKCAAIKDAKWYRSDPERIKIIKHKWGEKYPEKVREMNRNWKRLNPEKVRKMAKRYRKKLRLRQQKRWEKTIKFHEERIKNLK